MRYKITDQFKQEIYVYLRSNKLSMDKFSAIIGFDIKNILLRNKSINENHLIKIKTLIPISSKLNVYHFNYELNFGKPIKIVQNPNNFKKLAEFIGIMLGDGNLRESLIKKVRSPFKSMQYIVRITLNNKDKEHIIHTKKLFNTLFGLNLNEYHQKNCVQLSCYSKKLVIALKQFGLIPNNKVKNQVGIPEWIFENKDWIKFCFVGLVDTDGSLYQTQNGYWVINFSNMSKKLLNDFQRMCDQLKVYSTKAKHCINICRQADVNHLLEEFPFHRIKKTIGPVV